MSERIGNQDPTELTRQVILTLADSSPNRTLTVMQILQEIRTQYFDYDDNDWRKAFSTLLVQGVLQLGDETATLVVPKPGKLILRKKV